MAIPAIIAALALLATAPSSGSSFEQQPQGPAALACRTQPDSDACAGAIAAEVDPAKKAQLFYWRAYAEDESEHYDQAIADLTQTLALLPGFPPALHERAYALNSMARYHEAEADLTALMIVEPQEASHYQERAFARFYQGNLAGEFTDRDAVVRLRPNEAASLLARARSEMWLGRFADARRDIDAASAAANDDHSRQSASQTLADLQVWTATSSADPKHACDLNRLAQQTRPQNLIGDCTAWFLGAQSNTEKANALTVRAAAWHILQNSETDWVIDMQIAVALEPDNPDWRTNLGMGFMAVRHSRAAVWEFNRSIELHPSWIAYAGRGAAKFNIGDSAGAFEDARTSFDQHPNELACTTLGDLAYSRHDIEAAKSFWLGAYALGDRDDALMARLAQVGVTDPAHAARH